MIHIKILGVSIAALAASAVIGAAYGKTVRLSPLGGIGAAVSADEGDIVKVKGRGVGTTRAEALKDAYRDAVERAVGLYVDAESVVNNDELVEDKILTHSNAYIEKYDEIGIKKIDGGLIQIRIVATVKKSELTASLAKALPKHARRYEGSFKDIHAQIVSEEKRDADGCKLLQNTLMGLDPCTLLAVPSVDMARKQVIKKAKRNPHSCGNPPEIPDGQVVLRMLLRLKFDEKKYFTEFVPTIKPVLDQIASSSKKVKLSFFDFNTVGDSNSSIDMTLMSDYLKIGDENARFSRDRSGVFPMDFHENLFGQEACMSTWRVLYGGGLCFGMKEGEIRNNSGCKWVGSEGLEGVDQRGMRNRSWGNGWMEQILERNQMDDVDVETILRETAKLGIHGDDYMERPHVIALVCGVNKAHTIWDAMLYEIDKRSAAVFKFWIHRFGSGRSRGPDGPDATYIKYNVSYCDKDGDAVLMNTWRIPRSCLMNAACGRLNTWQNNKTAYYYVSPFFGCYSEEFVQWHDALIKTDMLQEIESVKIGMDN